ncbi:MAG: four helix bundle protein [Deltaproteobacteria bacterium]
MDFLECYQAINKKVYHITSSFRKIKKCGLVNKMRISLISIWSNLTQCSSRTSSKDQAHIYQKAFSSMM